MAELLSAKAIVEQAILDSQSMNSIGVLAAQASFDDINLKMQVEQELSIRSPSSLPAFQDTSRKLAWLYQEQDL
jgi:hypothetical protein